MLFNMESLLVIILLVILPIILGLFKDKKNKGEMHLPFDLPNDSESESTFDNFFEREEKSNDEKPSDSYQTLEYDYNSEQLSQEIGNNTIVETNNPKIEIDKKKLIIYSEILKPKF